MLNIQSYFRPQNRIAIILVSAAMQIFAAIPGICLDSVGEAYMEQADRASKRGDYKAAKKLLKKASRETSNPYQDKLYLGRLYNDLGECYRKLADDPNYTPDPSDDEEQGLSSHRDLIPLAERYLDKSLEIKEGLLGTQSIVLAAGLENLAELYLEDNKLDESEALYRKAIGIRQYKAGARNCDSASDYLRLGDICAHVNRHSYAEAIQNYEKAMSLWLTCSKPNEPVIGKCHQQMAMLYSRAGALSKAATQYDAAVSIYTQNLPLTRMNLSYIKKQLPDLPQDVYMAAWSEYQNKKATLPPRSHKLIPYLQNIATAARRFGKTTDVEYSEGLIHELASTK